MSVAGHWRLAIMVVVVLAFSLGGGALGAASDITLESATLVLVPGTGRPSGDVIITGTYVCTAGQSTLRARAVQGPAEASNFGTFGEQCTGATQSYSLLLANTSKQRVHPGPATITVWIGDDDGETSIEESVFLEH